MAGLSTIKLAGGTGLLDGLRAHGAVRLRLEPEQAKQLQAAKPGLQQLFGTAAGTTRISNLERLDRLALTFKFRAHPDACLTGAHSALQLAGHQVTDSKPVTVAEFSTRWDETHQSVNGQPAKRRRVEPGSSGSVAVAAGQGSAHAINLKVYGPDGSGVWFKIKQNIKLGKLMDAYCKHAGHDPENVRFIFDGENLRFLAHKTPDELGMEDGDVIEMVMAQCGD